MENKSEYSRATSDYIKSRVTLLSDIMKFGTTEAIKRIGDVAKNAELSPREGNAVMVKAGGDMMVASLQIAMDDGMPKEMALELVESFKNRVKNYKAVDCDLDTLGKAKTAQ